MRTVSRMAALVALPFALGCRPGASDSGTPVEDSLPRGVPVSVAGTVRVLPEAEASLAQVPRVDGLTLKLEDPLRAALQDPDAVLAQVKVPASGDFAAGPFSSDGVSIALSG